jgi:flavin-dependent dehydrogenase
LATLGHAVTLLVRAKAQRHPMGETAPVLAIELLEEMGLGHVVEMATYRVTTMGLTIWDSEAPAAHPSHAILLRRDHFDALLRRAAESAGVRAFELAFCAAPRRRRGGGWILPLATSAGDGCIEADFLVDARGRRGGARRLGAATVALAASWRDAAPMPAATCIEAASDAWAWGGVAPDRRQAAACFVDPERVAGLDAAGRLTLYADLLARMRLLRRLLDGRICAPPVVLDATARFAANIAEPDRIAIGDAAVATEPLSSQGVQGAIVSALQGAAVVHTALTRAEDKALALDFHRRSRLAAARIAQRNAAAFHTAVLARFETPFWRRRAVARDAAPPHVSADAAHKAFDAPLRLSPSARVQDGAMLDGPVIRRRLVLEHPALDAPLAYLGPVELAPLLEAVPFPATSTQLFRAWSERVGPDRANAVLSWLCSRGLLIAA